MVPIGLVQDVSQRHVGALNARALLTSTMAVADFMGAYLRELGLQKAYSASQRLILSMVDRQKKG